MKKFKRKHPVCINDPEAKKGGYNFFGIASLEEEKQRQLEEKLRKRLMK